MMTARRKQEAVLRVLRWTIEECFERARDDLGLDHCEARRPGQPERNESGRNSRRLSPMAALLPTMPEIRPLLARLLLRPPTGTFFVIGWSPWRRQHQLNAAIAHYKCRANVQLSY